MPWQRSDKKRYSGKIQSIFVSLTEAWDVEHFIDEYLGLRGFTLSDTNRDRIALLLEAAPGRSPYRAVQMVTWLDKQRAATTGAPARRSAADATTSLYQSANTTSEAVEDTSRAQPHDLSGCNISSLEDEPNNTKLPSTKLPAQPSQVAEPISRSAGASVIFTKPFGDGQREAGRNESL